MKYSYIQPKGAFWWPSRPRKCTESMCVIVVQWNDGEIVPKMNIPRYTVTPYHRVPVDRIDDIVAYTEDNSDFDHTEMETFDNHEEYKATLRAYKTFRAEFDFSKVKNSYLSKSEEYGKTRIRSFCKDNRGNARSGSRKRPAVRGKNEKRK